MCQKIDDICFLNTSHYVSLNSLSLSFIEETYIYSPQNGFQGKAMFVKINKGDSL